MTEPSTARVYQAARDLFDEHLAASRPEMGLDARRDAWRLLSATEHAGWLAAGRWALVLAAQYAAGARPTTAPAGIPGVVIKRG